MNTEELKESINKELVRLTMEVRTDERILRGRFEEAGMEIEGPAITSMDMHRLCFSRLPVSMITSSLAIWRDIACKRRAYTTLLALDGRINECNQTSDGN